MIKMNQTEMLELKDTIIELKNSLEGFKSRLDQAKEWVSEFEGKSFEIMWRSKKKKEWKRVKKA